MGMGRDQQQTARGTHLRYVHRVITLFIVAFTLYLGVTGTLIQLIDLRTLFSNAPAEDVEMASIREGLNGPGPFQVIAYADYTATALPADLNVQAALSKLLSSARTLDATAPLNYLEVRMADGKPVGQAQLNEQVQRFDLETGGHRGSVIVPVESQRPDSQRNAVKSLHRMTTFGNWILWVNVLVGLSLGVMIVTGIVMYFQLLSARARSKRSGLFWKAGGWWRTLHRWISVVAAVFLLVVALSGTWLAVESLGVGIYRANHRNDPAVEPISPLRDADVSSMANTTLTAYRSALPDTPIKVLRLRTYGGMPQGVVITGEAEARQIVFNAVTGDRAGQTEPGYPVSGFPFGWQAHQIAKQVHRGDFIGLTGRWMDLFAGLSLIFLSISGAVMYFDMWQRRKGMGRNGLLWK